MLFLSLGYQPSRFGKFAVRFASLSSGSRANALFVQQGDTRVLVDCGLSAREAARRLEQIGEDPDAIDAIAVTHEHSDHIKGIRVFASRHNCKVIINKATYAACRNFFSLPTERAIVFPTGKPFQFQELDFESFSVSHDAVDPVMFRIRAGSFSLTLATDLGHVTDLVRNYVTGSQAVILEANHDPEMLQLAPYPWQVKQRIFGRMGHLSNGAASELTAEIMSGEKLPELILAAHISENSNCPEKAIAAIKAGAKRADSCRSPQIIALNADNPSLVFDF